MAETEKIDNRKSVTLKLSPELYAELEKLATEDERSVAAYTERYLRKQFARGKQVTESSQQRGAMEPVTKF